MTSIQIKLEKSNSHHLELTSTGVVTQQFFCISFYSCLVSQQELEFEGLSKAFALNSYSTAEMLFEGVLPVVCKQCYHQMVDMLAHFKYFPEKQFACKTSLLFHTQ